MLFNILDLEITKNEGFVHTYQNDDFSSLFLSCLKIALMAMSYLGIERMGKSKGGMGGQIINISSAAGKQHVDGLTTDPRKNIHTL